ncbi:MAG: uncharacterized membrane protein (UPF0127 family) [Cognaticolwellia sp.]|jgi:uncharacterized membrane protein (UPF0127 family)
MLWTLPLALPLTVSCASKKVTLPMADIQVGQQTISVELADDPAERHQGLMYRSSMDAEHGMLFVYPNTAPRSFWMENTSIPLSIAFLDETGRVLNIENMTPYDRSGVPSAGAAMYALEMNRGWFERNGVQVGSVVGGLPGASEN